MALHLAVDMDDVILDFMGGIKHAVETEYGVAVPDWDDWDMTATLNPILGQNWWKWMRQRDWLWPNFPALDGSIGGLTQLRGDGHYLEIVTSKPEWAEYAVWKWLGKWRPPVQQVTIVGPQDRKVDMTDADLLIDDKPANVNEFADEGRMAILFDRPHNRVGPNMGIRPSVARVAGWPNVVQYIRMEEAAGWPSEEELMQS